MRSLGKWLFVYMIFFLGTTGIIHVDRQGAAMHCQPATMTETVQFTLETVENTIEKYTSLR